LQIARVITLLRVSFVTNSAATAIAAKCSMSSLPIA
jgi:hypothetical protein